MQKTVKSWLLFIAYLVVAVIIALDFSSRLAKMDPYAMIRLNTDDEDQLVAVEEGKTIVQTLNLPSGASGLALLVDTKDEYQAGRLILTLTDAQTGSLLAEKSCKPSDLANEGRVDLLFDAAAQRLCRLEIRAVGGPVMVSLRSTSFDSVPEGDMTIGGEKKAGDLILRSMEPRPVRFAFVRIVFWVLFGLLAVCALLILRSGLSPAGRFAVLALAMGMAFLVSITPLSVPDEQTHYEAAYRVSNLLLLRPETYDGGNPAYFDYSRFSGQYNVGSAYDRICEEIGRPLPAPEQEGKGFYGSVAFPVMYLPQAIGLAAGQLLGLNMVMTFWLGRFLNLLFYILCCYFAIRLTTRYGLMFSLTALMPMALQQAASFSYDGFVNGVGLLLLALLFRAVDGRGAMRITQTGSIVLAGTLLACAKPIYLPVMLMMLLIPSSRFRSGKQRWGILAGSILLVLGGMIITRLGGILAVTASGTGGQDVQMPETYSLGLMLSQPLKVMNMAYRTLRIQLDGWIRQGIGCLLSGLTLEIKGWKIGIMACLLLLSTMVRKDDEKEPGMAERFLCPAIFAMTVALAMVTMLMGWTPLDADWIQGVQGRYLVPVLPLLWLVMRSKHITVSEQLEKPMILGMALLQMTVICEVLRYTAAK